MAEDKIVSFEEKQKASEKARLVYEEDMGEFELHINDQMSWIFELCGPDELLPLKHNGNILLVPFRDFADAIEKRLQSGMAVVRVVDHVAEVIPLKKSVKPKKPKNPDERVLAMPVRQTTPEELAARRAELAASREKLRRNREERLAHLREHYGEEAAQAFQALAGWK